MLLSGDLEQSSTTMSVHVFIWSCSSCFTTKWSFIKKGYIQAASKYNYYNMTFGILAVEFESSIIHSFESSVI